MSKLRGGTRHHVEVVEGEHWPRDPSCARSVAVSAAGDSPKLPGESRSAGPFESHVKKLRGRFVLIDSFVMRIVYN